MIREMHEEEEEDSSVATLIEDNSSLLPVFGDTIFPVGGTLKILQKVPTHQLIQGMHPLSFHIFFMPLIETYGNMPSGPLHDQGL